MYIEISSPNDFRNFESVERVVFHSINGDKTYTNHHCINHNESYTALTLYHNSTESSFNNSYVITKVVQ